MAEWLVRANSIRPVSLQRSRSSRVTRLYGLDCRLRQHRRRRLQGQPAECPCACMSPTPPSPRTFAVGYGTEGSPYRRRLRNVTSLSAQYRASRRSVSLDRGVRATSASRRSSRQHRAAVQIRVGCAERPTSRTRAAAERSRGSSRATIPTGAARRRPVRRPLVDDSSGSRTCRRRSPLRRFRTTSSPRPRSETGAGGPLFALALEVTHDTAGEPARCWGRGYFATFHWTMLVRWSAATGPISSDFRRARLCAGRPIGAAFKVRAGGIHPRERVVPSSIAYSSAVRPRARLGRMSHPLRRARHRRLGFFERRRSPLPVRRLVWLHFPGGARAAKSPSAPGRHVLDRDRVASACATPRARTHPRRRRLPAQPVPGCSSPRGTARRWSSM